MRNILAILALSLTLSSVTTAQTVAHTALELDFMDGRWVGKYNNLTVVSHYISGNALVFVGRTFMKGADGKTQFAELMRVDNNKGQLVLTTIPQGTKGTSFQLTAITQKSATFENPANLFPSKIQYAVVDNVLITTATGVKNGKPAEIKYNQTKIPEAVDY